MLNGNLSTKRLLIPYYRVLMCLLPYGRVSKEPHPRKDKQYKLLAFHKLSLQFDGVKKGLVGRIRNKPGWIARDIEPDMGYKLLLPYIVAKLCRLTRLNREKHDNLAQFILGMGYTNEYLHFPRISKRFLIDFKQNAFVKFLFFKHCKDAMQLCNICVYGSQLVFQYYLFT